MVFIETDSFNKAITALMPDEDYARLQQACVDDPELGDLIPGTGGMRKVRWTPGGKGKSGGARVIYFWRDRAAQIIFLMVYGKGVKTNLTAGEKRRLKQAAEALKQQTVSVDMLLGAAVKKANFNALLESVRQAGEIVRGERAPAREFHIDADSIKKLRASTGLSQPKFATLLRVDLGTLRNWEQGRRVPTGPAKALLTAIERDPRNVLKALMT
jgi:putative transcriptional regulator